MVSFNHMELAWEYTQVWLVTHTLLYVSAECLEHPWVWGKVLCCMGGESALPESWGWVCYGAADYGLVWI